jgi:hypothetical protein
LKKSGTTGETQIDGVSRACALCARILILLSAFLLVAMPWSENFFHFDDFPRGGEDFELSVFLLVAIFGLVLVLLQHGKRGVTFLLALRGWLSCILQRAGFRAPQHFGGLVASLHAPPILNPTLGNYNLPMQV